MPFAPAHRRNCPIDAAIPMHVVATSHGTKFIVSKIAIPAYTEPPGEFMYREMSFSGLSAASRSNLALMSLASGSVTSAPRNTMRSWRRRSNTSPPGPYDVREGDAATNRRLEVQLMSCTVDDMYRHVQTWGCK